MSAETPEQVAQFPRRRRASLRTVLITAFATQIILVCGLVGWLSFRHGMASVDEMAQEVAHQVTTHVNVWLKNYVEGPTHLVKTNAAALRMGILEAKNPDTMSVYFANQIRRFEHVGYIGFGTLENQFVGVERLDDQNLRHKRKDLKVDMAVRTYEVKEDNALGKMLDRRDDYEVHNRPWYKRAFVLDDLAEQAKKAGKSYEPAGWTGIYPAFSTDDALYLSAVEVVKKGYNYLGVVVSDLVVSQVSHFLADTTKNELAFDPPAIVYVVDKNTGTLVATSNGTAAVRRLEKDTIENVKAEDAESPEIRESARVLQQEFGAFADLPIQRLTDSAAKSNRFFVDSGNERYLAEFQGLSDDYGLQWVTVVLVPESAFLDDIKAGTWQTLFLCILAVIMAILAARVLARRIARPLVVLAEKARRIHEGDLSVSFVALTNDEVGELMTTMNEMVCGLRDRDFIRDAFGRYVTPELADTLISDPESLRLGGELREVTILMSDLRGFTSLSERLTAEEMVTLLNRYLGVMTHVIQDYKGTIIEFIGDAILVVFGAPFQHDDDAERAVRCAVKMQLEMQGVNEENAKLGVSELHMGIGVHTGEVVAGNIGSEQHAKYGVVGEAVNLTARIESLTLGSQVLMSESTIQRCPDTLITDEPDQVRLKGVSEPLNVYQVRGFSDDDGAVLASDQFGDMLELNCDVHCFVISGYEVEETPTEGRTQRLGSGGMEFEIGRELAERSKLKFKLCVGEHGWTSDAYGLVIEGVQKEGSETWLVTLAFTSWAPEDKKALEAFVEQARAGKA